MSATTQQAATERAWAHLTIGGIGDFDGEVVDVSGRRVSVALHEAVRGAATRETLLTLGVGDDSAGGFVATIMEVTTTSDGRPCLLMLLQDGKDHERRRARRLPFANKIEMLIVRGSAGSDPRIAGIGVNLAVGGLALRAERAVPVRTEVLLRFRVPPVRGTTVQVRGTVLSCRPDPESGYVHGIRFERISGRAAVQLRNAVRHLSDLTD